MMMGGSFSVTSRMMPPKQAVKIPMTTATPGPTPASSAFCAPSTANSATPIASAHSSACEARSSSDAAA